MDYRLLGRTGLQLSAIGFGGSPLGNEFGAVDPEQSRLAVRCALDVGINFFDVSPYYGRTLAETRLGEALEGNRHRAVLATKCGRYDVQSFDFSAARVRSSVDESLLRLKTDYLDLLAAHDVEFGDREQIINETLPAMRELKSQGKVRHIGVSGLPLRMLAYIVERSDVDYVLSYCHYNLITRDLDRWLTPLLKTKGVGLINASPLHMRLLTQAGPPPWHPAPETLRRVASQVVALCQSWGADPTAVALRFCLDHPYAASALVGMSSALEVQDNLKSLNTPVDLSLLDEINRLIAPVSDLTWASGRPQNSDV